MKNETRQLKSIFKGEKESKSRKGRSNKLLENRNQCLLARYYYYGAFSDKRYNVIMQQLRDEFFLSTSTIQDIVEDHMTYLHELKNLEPKRAYFEKLWPHLLWP